MPGGILMVIIASSPILGFSSSTREVTAGASSAMPSLTGERGSRWWAAWICWAPSIPVVQIPTVLALVMTAVFDATGTIRAVAGQAGLINERGHIISGGRPDCRLPSATWWLAWWVVLRRPSTSNPPLAPPPVARPSDRCAGRVLFLLMIFLPAELSGYRLTPPHAA